MRGFRNTFRCQRETVHEKVEDHRLNAAKKFVVSHRSDGFEWGPFERVADVVDDVRRIKSEDGPTLVLCGSTTLTSPLLELGLADEVVLCIYPLLLGQGKRFFVEGTPARTLELVNSQATPTGVLLNTYKVVGALKNAWYNWQTT